MLAIRVRLHRSGESNGTEKIDDEDDAGTHDDAVDHAGDDAEFHHGNDDDDGGRATSESQIVVA